MTKIKLGVKFAKVDEHGELHVWKPEMQDAHEVIEKIFLSWKSPCVITSALDGKHKERSLHYVGYATDYRIWHISKDRRKEFARVVQLDLGPAFDVVLHKTHLHVEYDPD